MFILFADRYDCNGHHRWPGLITIMILNYWSSFPLTCLQHRNVEALKIKIKSVTVGNTLSAMKTVWRWTKEDHQCRPADTPPSQFSYTWRMEDLNSGKTCVDMSLHNYLDVVILVYTQNARRVSLKMIFFGSSHEELKSLTMWQSSCGASAHFTVSATVLQQGQGAGWRTVICKL